MAREEKDKVPKIKRVKNKPRRSYFRKRILKDKKRILRWIQDEMKEAREGTSSVKECQEQILNSLDDLGAELAHAREVTKHVILNNDRTIQLMDLMIASVLTGSGTATDQGVVSFDG